MIDHRTLFLIFVAWSFAGIAIAETPERFANRFALHAQAAGEGLHRVILPASVYLGLARHDQGDMRVFNAAGELVPFALVDSPPPLAPAPISTALPWFPLRAPQGSRLDDLELEWRPGDARGTLKLRANAGGTTDERLEHTIGWLLDARSIEQNLTALSLDWPEDQTLRVTLSLDASDDLQHWRPLVAAAEIVRLRHAGQSLTQTRIEFPPVRARYLRISWAESDAAPPEPRACVVETRGGRAESPRQWTELDSTTTGEPGEYRYDKAPLARIDQVQIIAPQPNTAVTAQLLAGRPNAARPDGFDWTPVLRTNVYRMTRDGAESLSPPTAISRTTTRNWLLRIDTKGGGFGAGVPRLRVSWPEQTLLFAARGSGPYVLAFGNHEMLPGTTAAENLLPDFEKAQLGLLPLAMIDEAPVVKPERTDATDWRQPALWGALIGAVAILAGMAWRLLREVSKTDA